MTTENLLASNLAIAASAGSGKTFALAHRYIGLLLQGVEPERIVALTFSRKAAGEIFDSIVHYLVEAATSDREARRMGDHIGLPVDRGRAVALLRRLLTRLHRLQTGTLDSFAVRVLRAFPLELGIDPRIVIIDDNEAGRRLLQRAALRRYFAGLDPEARAHFFESFRRASFGGEPRRFTDSLLSFIADCHDLYLDYPEAAQWGDPAALWPQPPAWLSAPPPTAADIHRFLELVEPQVPAKVFGRLAAFSEALAQYSPAVSPPRPVAYVLDRLDTGSLEAPVITLKMERATVDLEGEACRLLQRFVGWLLRCGVEAQADRLRAIHAIMAGYERIYDREFRRRGLVGFDDIHRLLQQGFSDFDIAERIGFRLDGRFDHWLLDEFQDTSLLQWRVLEPLVAECIQDDGRTFFYVGDVKQAIYGWRQGDARIFGAILDYYGDGITRKDLDSSYRSVKPVIDTVNRVFAALGGDALPAEAVQRWHQAWREHQSARDPAEPGCVLLVEPDCKEGKHKPEDWERFQLTGAILRQVDPLRRGLTGAILVRTNDTARQLVAYLRRECPEVPVCLEGVSGLQDTPLTQVLLALVRYAAHPGDTYSRGVLAMSPLADTLDALGYEEAGRRVLEQIYRHGFRACLEDWARQLPADRFGRQRLAELLLAADRFDASQPPDCDAFLASMEAHEFREGGTASMIRVMTIHQAKGLGFDLVILPDLQGRSGLDQLRSETVWRWEGGCIGMPHRPLARLDPTLAGILEAKRAEAAYESLCLLYVAMTRAKRALYMVTSFPGKTSRVLHFAALVKQALIGDPRPVSGRPISIGGITATELYAAGDPSWFETIPLQPQREPEPPSPPWRPVVVERPVAPMAPSAVGEEDINAGEFLAATTEARLDLGTAVHHLFEQLAWIDDLDLEDFLAAWRRTAPFDAQLQDRAVAHFRAAVAAPEIAAALRRPQESVTLWREQPFDVLLDGRRVTGVFDRVVIHGSPTEPTAAWILDYKTNSLADEAAIAAACDHYRPQLELYRQALAVLLSLPPDRIGMRLLFTGPGRVVDLAEATSG